MKHIFDPDWCDFNKNRANKDHLIQDVTCIKCLERFIKAFDFAAGINLARARLKELKKEKK